MAMFTTHIAMAIQRILNGDVENPLEEAVLEELRKEEAYEKADEVAEKIYDIIEVEFPETEKEYLVVHLCNLFHKKNKGGKKNEDCNWRNAKK